MARDKKTGESKTENFLWYEVLDKAFEISCHLNYHRLYGSEEKALRHLRRQCPGVPKEDLAEAFRKSYEMFDALSTVFAMYHGSGYSLQTSELIEELKKLCPEYSFATCRKALNWLFDYYRI